MVSTEATALLRKHIQRFISLTDNEWDLLIPHLQEKKLSKNQFFIQEGKKEKNIAFVIEGNLRQFYTRDGEEQPISILKTT